MTLNKLSCFYNNSSSNNNSNSNNSKWVNNSTRLSISNRLWCNNNSYNNCKLNNKIQVTHNLRVKELQASRITVLEIQNLMMASPKLPLETQKSQGNSLKEMMQMLKIIYIIRFCQTILRSLLLIHKFYQYTSTITSWKEIKFPFTMKSTQESMILSINKLKL